MCHYYCQSINQSVSQLGIQTRKEIERERGRDRIRIGEQDNELKEMQCE